MTSIKSLFIVLINLIVINTTILLDKSEIKIDNKKYSKISLKLDIKKIDDDIYEMSDNYLPSDLISFLPKNAEFSIQILQGTLDEKLQSQFYPLDSIGINNLISDYPSGKFFYSKNFGPFYNEELFKKYFDVFANTFKLTLNTLFDRSAYILYKENMILIDSQEIPCNIHLDSIKETLPKKEWENFSKKVNYHQFLNSDFKSIKYHIKNYKNKVKYDFEIISRKLDQFERVNKQKSNKSVVNYNISDYIKSNRYLDGIQFNFDDFTFKHEIELANDKIKKSIINKDIDFEIIELIPTSVLIPKYGTLNITFYQDNEIVKELKAEEIPKYFLLNLIEKTEDKFPEIPFTYENKKTTQLNLKYKGDIKNFNKIEINLKLTKSIMNFESFSNQEEWGFVYPCGIIIIGKEYTITNYIFFNFPNIDVTMPFNIISLSWFVYGFMVVQILNIVLGKSKGKGILDTLKERFVAKWSWIWRRG